MLSKIILVLAVSACAAVPSSIVRPCKSLDLECVARHLAARSGCERRVRGVVPAEYCIERFGYHAPFFNATYIDNDLVIRNHDKCYLSEFYLNMKTQMLVIGVDCPGLEFESTRTVIQHFSLREDVTFDYQYHGTYPMLRMTTCMPMQLPDLCSSYTQADVTALPDYGVTPNNPKTSSYLSKDDIFLNIYERETFFYRANLLARFYINSIICDFGCDF